MQKSYNLIDCPVDILSIDKTFAVTDVNQKMIFKGTRSGKLNIFHYTC